MAASHSGFFSDVDILTDELEKLNLTEAQKYIKRYEKLLVAQNIITRSIYFQQVNTLEEIPNDSAKEYILDILMEENQEFYGEEKITLDNLYFKNIEPLLKKLEKSIYKILSLDQSSKYMAKLDAKIQSRVDDFIPEEKPYLSPIK